MDINPAKKQLRFAQAFLEEMKTSGDLEDAERCWNGFLNHIEQVFEKVRLACSTVCKKYPSFISPINAQRNNDPLLVYLKQARNTLHHGLAEVSGRDAEHFEHKVYGDKISINRMVIKAGKIVEYDGNRPMHTDFVPEKIIAVDIVNRMIRYPVPTDHLGTPIYTQNPLEIGGHGLAYYQRFLEKVESELISK